MGRATTPYLLLLPAAALYAIFIVYPIFRQFQISFYNWHIFPGAQNPVASGSLTTARSIKDPAIRTAALQHAAIRGDHSPDPDAAGAICCGRHDRSAPGTWLAASSDLHPGDHLVGGRRLCLRGYIFGSTQGGLANAVLSASLPATRSAYLDWLAQRWTGDAVIWIVSIWKGVGYSFILFLAALDGVPRTLLEAARVDGAREPRVWRQVVVLERSGRPPRSCSCSY